MNRTITESSIEELRRRNRAKTEQLLRQIRRATMFPAAVALVAIALIVLLAASSGPHILDLFL